MSRIAGSFSMTGVDRMDIYGFYKGEVFGAYEFLGAHPDKEGTVFRTYAPNASKVSLIGDFSEWEDIPMEKILDGNFYKVSCPKAKEGMRYKYRIYDRNGNFIDHCDPYGFGMEVRPGTCSVIRSIESYRFTDKDWLSKRTDCRDKPMNIYEVNLASWKKHENGDYYTYQQKRSDIYEPVFCFFTSVIHRSTAR